MQSTLFLAPTRYGQPMQVWSGGTWTGESLFEVVWPWAEDLGHRSWYPCRGRSWWSGAWQLGSAAFRQGTRTSLVSVLKSVCKAYWSWVICKICIFASNIQLLDTLGGTQHHPTPLTSFGWLVPGLDEFLVLSQHSSHLQIWICASSFARWAIRRADPCASPWGGPWAFGNSWRPTAPSTARPWKPLRPVTDRDHRRSAMVGHGRLRKSCACWEGKCWQMIHWIWWKADPSCFFIMSCWWAWGW